MKVFNCNIKELLNKIEGQNIFFFGQGTWLKYVEYTDIMKLSDNFRYVVDNNPRGCVTLEEKKLQVYYPEQLKEEQGGVIIVTSSTYMLDMYNQLMNMELSDKFGCCFFPFIQLVSTKKEEKELITESKNENKIPKIIHSFWFSGEEKPELYQKCIDTWSEYLPDYEIREWDIHNYNWHKNRFVEKAIECEAWAFASDYARLDVVNEYGGIYLDMDVEVLKSFNPLLDNKCFFGFANNVVIDLAIFGAQKHNSMIESLLDLYKDIAPPDSKKEFNHFFQPLFVRKMFAEKGIVMDGSCQQKGDVSVYSDEYFMPIEYILFKEKITNKSFCIHHNNYGWDETGRKKDKKKAENLALYNIISNNA